MIIPAGYAQVNIKMGGAALPLGAQVTFGVENPLGQVANSIASSVIAAFNSNNVPGFISTGVQFVSVLVKRGPNATGEQQDLPWGVPGERAGAVCPPNVAFLVRKQTQLGGRKGRGRMFFPGVIDTDVDGAGIVVPAVAAGLLDDLGNAFADLVNDSLSPMLLHGDGATQPTLITSLFVDPRVATQRRRLRR